MHADNPGNQHGQLTILGKEVPVKKWANPKAEPRRPILGVNLLVSGSCVLAMVAGVLDGGPSPASAAGPVTVHATGLDNPRGLSFGADGTLYVAEAGTGGGTSTVGECPHSPPPIGPFLGGLTARVSAIDSEGTRTTFVDELPSAQTSPLSGSELLGTEEVVFLGR